MRHFFEILLLTLLLLAGSSCGPDQSLAGPLAPYFSNKLPGGPLHLYAEEYPNEVPDYPFGGQELPRALYPYFGKEPAEGWSNLGWGVFAVGRYENHFLLRIPGQYTSDQLALYEKNGDGLRYLLSLASKWCDEGWCNRQDAWLGDLNGDRRYDVVTHYAQLDDQGGVVEESLDVYLQDTSGSFVRSPDFPVRPGDYPLTR